MKKIKGRLENSLGGNDLRDYLLQKDETSRVRNNHLSIFKKKLINIATPLRTRGCCL